MLKKIETIISPFQFDQVKVALLDIGVDSMTVSEVHRHTQHEGRKVIYRGCEYELDIPKVKLEIVISSDLADEVITALCGAARVNVLVYDVAEAIRIRTNEYGEQTL